MVSSFGSGLVFPAASPAASSQDLSQYLNQVVGWSPPLRVEGVPPLVQIYLPQEQVWAIAQVLPQIETALGAARGFKYWDVYIYLGNGPGNGDRLIYHRLLERPGSEPLKAQQPQSARLPARSAAVSCPTASWSDGMPASPWRSRLAQRRKATRRKRLAAGAIVIGGCSCVLGMTVALGGGERSPFSWWKSRRETVPPIASTVSSPPLMPSSAALSDPEAATNLSPDRLILSPLSDASTGLQALAPVVEVSPAVRALMVPPVVQPAVRLKAVGDIIPGTNFPDYRIPDPNYLFNSVKMFLGEVDILFGNFESTLTNYPYSAKDISRGMTFAFRTPPEFADVLRAAGFDVLSVANNHAFDFGDPGFNDTIAHIEQAGMRAVGRKNDIVVVEANGYAIAFIGFSYWDDHNNLNDLATATSLVQTAQAQADMVVISVHGGAEGTDALRVQNRTEYFFSENRGNLVQFSRAMVDAGADLILGHGPHVPRAIELYQNKLIAYSLGNFLGYRTLSTQGPLGRSLILQVELSPEGDFLQGRVIPVALDPNGVPYIDNFFESVTLVRRLTAQDFPETPLTIDPMGYILRTDQP